MDNKQRAQGIYEHLMRWLEGKGEHGGKPTLEFTVPDGDSATRVIRFRKQTVMGGTARAVSLDDDKLVIDYNPHWESVIRIERLLEPTKTEA